MQSQKGKNAMARRAPIKKSKFRCLNGPYEGEDLLLSTPNTLTFEVNGFKGRYVQGYHNKRTTGCHPIDHARFSNLDASEPLFVASNKGTELVWLGSSPEIKVVDVRPKVVF